jgi:hypothetical protein
MNLKQKLSFGLGFLFLIIFSLTIFFCYFIETLSKESGNILKDNYASIVYSKKMFLTLDDMKNSISGNIFYNVKDKKLFENNSKIFDSGKADFDKNLKDESNNITEKHEKEYVDSLKNDYGLLLKLSNRLKNNANSKLLYLAEYLPLYLKVRHNIENINNINMEAVVRKNQIVKNDSSRIINYMIAIGIGSIILALGYFWYFPFYISNSVSYLSDKMKDLLKNLGIKLNVKSEDENFIILQSINLLEKKFLTKNKKK